MSKTVNLIKLGLLSYNNGLKIQQYYVNKLKEGMLRHNNGHASPNEHIGTLLLLEHTPVYTIGIRSLKQYDEALQTKLNLLGAEYYKTNRGGLITFHGPGQLVAYPILNLKKLTPSIKWFVRHLEQTVIELLRSPNTYRLHATTIPEYTGVWIDGERKVCAIGVHCSMYVTHHGLAINCNTDLSWFDHIVPCGIEHKKVTSLSAETNRDVSVDEVRDKFVRCFENVFKCRCVDEKLTKQIQLMLI